jgi:hypothetical protein
VPQINQEGVISLAPSWQTPPSILFGIHPEYSYYQNLEYLGRVPSGSSLKHKLPYERSMNQFSTYIGDSERMSLQQLAGDKYYLSVPNLENVAFSIATFENKPPADFNDNFHRLSLKYLYQVYGCVCKDAISTSEEIVVYIDLTKSPGYPANMFGFKNKLALIQDSGFLKYLYSNQHLKTTPIWCVHPKEEFKMLDDLKALKIRLFTIPPYDLLYEQLRFGKKISEKMKSFRWSAYGFNPYSGGADRMARSLLLKRIRLFYDVSGWDKFLPLMEDVFGFIRHHTVVPPHLRSNFEWMAHNTCNYIFKTPHGHTFRKKYGNPSGSGTTTRDNILAHILILASALFECFFIKYNDYPTMEYISEQIIFLFGDDSIISLDLEFDHILTDGYLQSHFAKYGLKLKFLYGGLDYDICKMQFLGFTFTDIDGVYYPKYDMEKLATSVIYRNGRNDSREAFTSRLFTIMLMSYPTQNVFPILRRAFTNWCQYLVSIQADLTPTEESFVSMCSITEQTIKQMYQGWESNVSEDFIFSLHIGWKEATKDYVYTCLQ